MRGAHVLLVLMALAAVAPNAAGDQPLVGDPVCGEGAVCAPSGLCLEGVACHPTVCDPATDCEARAASGARCQENLTIDGQTCAQRVSVQASLGGRALPVPGSHVVPGAPLPGTRVPVPGTSVGLDADLSEGFVRGQHLPNQWSSDGASARLVVADLDLGRTTVSLYHAQIGRNETSAHDFTSARGDLRHESALATAAVGLGALLMDGAPEDCALDVRSPAGVQRRTCGETPLLA